MPIPEIIPIAWMEDLHTEFIGHCADGTQFFLNEVFVFREPKSKNWQDSRHEYLVLYLFDSDGNYLKHESWYAGTTATLDEEILEAKRDEMLAELGEINFCNIAVRPFSVQIDGITFGLIDDKEKEMVTLQPSSQISFMAPWDGEYYT